MKRIVTLFFGVLLTPRYRAISSRGKYINGFYKYCQTMQWCGSSGNKYKTQILTTRIS